VLISRKPDAFDYIYKISLDLSSFVIIFISQVGKVFCKSQKIW
jgi:hypothetical protein